MKSGPVRVLLYSINFSPELTGIGKYNGEMVRWLTEKGCEVRVITAPPYYPHWKVQQGYSASRYTQEVREGARIWRCPVWVPAKATGLKRLLHLLSFAATSAPIFIRQLFWRPDVCFVVEPPLVVAPIAMLFSKLCGIRTWLHVQDFEVDAAFELGLLPDRGWLRKATEGVERWLMGGFNAVSSISGPMLKRLAGKGIAEERIQFFPNWVDIDAIRPLSQQAPNGFRMQLGYQEEHVVALYSGNMGEKQGLEVVLQAAALLKADSLIRFVLCGAGSALGKLESLADSMELTNVTFLPLQPIERLNELLGMADVHLLVQKRGASDLVMPSKLTGMLASGRAVLATAEEGTAVDAVMQQAQAGLVIPPEDGERLAEALTQLAGHADERQAYGKAGRRYAVEQLGYDSVMAAFHDSLIKLRAGRTNEQERTEQERSDKPHTVGSV